MLRLSNTTQAQKTDKPTITIEANRISDSVVNLIIHTQLPTGFKLFSLTPKAKDDAFISSFSLDKSLDAYIKPEEKITESGKLQSATDADAGQEIFFFADSNTISETLYIPATEDIRVKGTYSWLGKLNTDFPSGDTTFSVGISGNTTAATSTDTKSSVASASVEEPTVGAKDSSALSIFWTCFLAGLIMVFTPCVFPLIPVTVSFFLKKSSTKSEGVRNAVWYSLSIILIYTIPTFIITKVAGDAAMYKIATSSVANILFFLIFLIFAISFFGAFELTLPSSWANKADEKAGKGGLLGIFFMALTLVIVSFSCTGPIVGTLLAQVSGTSAKMAPVFGMLGLSAGLAIPFSIFAFFPSLLKSLPKSGGWLNSVKVVFGFVELALAMKFLSSVDLIYGWHLLDREVFLVIWIVLSFLCGLYLIGKLKFSHDSDLKYISIPRLFFAIAVFCFGLYLFPGLWGAPLKAMSGLLPPTTTQDFNLDELQYKIGNGAANVAPAAGTSAALPPKLYTDKLHDAPFGLTTYYDLDEGIAASKALNKPIMLDFTGHSCPNCRKMENEVWSNPDVLNRLRNDFVIISLYVDEYSDLPSSQVYKDKNGKEISTLGDKNLDYEKTKFGFNAQPLYMFIDADQKPLDNTKYGYDPDIQKFIKHLDLVKSNFEKEK